MRRILILILLLLPALAFNQTKIDSIDQATLSGTSKFPTIDGPEGAKRWKYFDGDQVREFSAADIVDRAYVPDTTGSHSIEADYGNFVRSTVDGNVYYCDYGGECRILINNNVSAQATYQNLIADGTDTINFASSALGVARLSTSGVDSIGLIFSNPVTGGQYTLHFQTHSTVNIGFPSTALFPNGSQIGIRTLADTAYTNLYFDGTNYVFNSTFGTAYSGGGGSGGGDLGGMNLTGTGFLADQMRTFAEEDYTLFPGAVADDNFAHSSIHFFSSPWNTYKYYNWYTPYPSEADENPYLAYSIDGITWDDTGISNPLIPQPAVSPGNYNSDTDFWYDSETDTAYLFWRYKNQAGNTDFFYVKSGDGRTVTDSTKIFSNLPNDEWASITVEKIDTVYHAWIVTIKDRPIYRLFHYAAISLTELENDTPDTCVLSNTPTGKGIWHVSIKYDSIYDQLIGVFNFADTTSSGSPNANGLQRLATSLDGVDWDVSEYNLLNELPSDNITGFNYDLGYRSSFARLEEGEPLYDRMGGIGIGVMNWNWKFSVNPFFVVPKAGKTAGGYEAAKDDIESIYSFYYRDSTFQGLPVAQVSIRDTLYNVFPAAKRGQLTWGNSGERVETLAGSDTIFINRWYDQENWGSQDDPPNYLSFFGSNQPWMERGPYSGRDSVWYIQFDRTLYQDVKSLTKSRSKGITFAGDHGTGVLYSFEGGAPYIGETGTGTSINIQDSGGYTGSTPTDSTTVISAIFGSSSVIRFEKNQVASGSTTASQDDNVYERPFARYLTGSIDNTSYWTGKAIELIVWKNQPDTATLEIVEDTLIANFDYITPLPTVDTILFDDFTGAAGTLNGRQPVIFSAIDSFWLGAEANWRLTGNGTATAINDEDDGVRIELGFTPTYEVDTTKTVIIETKIDFNTSEGWSGMYWSTVYNGLNGQYQIRVDQNDQAYLYRTQPTYVAVDQTPYTLPVDAIVTIRVEISEGTANIYFNDVLVLTDSNHVFRSDFFYVGMWPRTLDNDDVEWDYILVIQE
jgi:hypothetical protein